MDKERTPDYVELGRIDLGVVNTLFTDLRLECDKLGLTLERKGTRKYLLQGLDLPASGVECRNLDEVREEMMNYER